MFYRQKIKYKKGVDAVQATPPIPSRKWVPVAVRPPVLFMYLEYAFFAVILYGLVAGLWGLRVKILGSGMLALFAMVCVLELGSQAPSVFRKLVLPVGCATSFLILQFLVHGEPLLEGTQRNFITWIFSLIIIQALFLRPGFFHRFTVAIFVFGLLLLPYLSSVTPDSEYDRMALEGVSGLGNANALAEWFGFCAIVFLIIGIESKRGFVRTISWLSMLVCLSVITLTISRGTLISVAIASTIALRHTLKRSFLPIMIFLILSWVAFLLGVFDTAITSYSIRSTEETGRFVTWPRAIDRFLASPFEGVGVSNIKTYIGSKGKSISPHNGFITMALASGIVPLAFFVAYWVRAGWGAFFEKGRQLAETPFVLPLFIFVFLVNFGTNFAYMSPWSIVVLSLAIAAGNPRQIRGIMKFKNNKRLKNEKLLNRQMVGAQG